MTALERRLALPPETIEQLRRLQAEALALNARFNLVSQASASSFWLRHVLHSLVIATRPFPPGSIVVDWGTGGGLPGLPLAVVFPETHFVLVDSVGKKTRAAKTIARSLGLGNVETWQGRAEEFPGRATHTVSRATAPLPELWGWTERVLDPVPGAEGAWAAGLITLKGGDLAMERASVEALAQIEETPLLSLLGDDYFRDKVMLHVKHSGSTILTL